MEISLRLWVKPDPSGSCFEIFWIDMGEGNRANPKQAFKKHEQEVRVRLERSAKKFAESGKLPKDKGHRRKGKAPYRDLYEFKDPPSGVRMLAFNLKHTTPSGLGTYVVVLCVRKQKGDIEKSEEERAVRLMELTRDAAAAKKLKLIDP